MSEWKWVPVEPTYQMCEAMNVGWETGSGFPTRYKAMLAAAPTPPEVVDAKGTIVGCFLESKLTDGDIQRLLAYEKRMPASDELVKAAEGIRHILSMAEEEFGGILSDEELEAIKAFFAALDKVKP